MKKPLRPLLKYGIAIIAALLIAVPVAFLRGFSPDLPFSINARYLSDGFFVAGLLLTGVGSLIWVFSTDFFDIFAYGFKSLLVLCTAIVKPTDHQTFYEYKLSRDKKRKKASYFILIVGLVFLTLALICLLIYNG